MKNQRQPKAQRRQPVEQRPAGDMPRTATTSRAPAPKTKKIKRPTKVVTKYKYEIDHRHHYSFLTYLTVFVIFGGGIITLVFNAKMSLKELEMRQLADTQKQVIDEIAALNANLYGSYDLSEVEMIATTRLGMSRPQPHQIMHVKVDKVTESINYFDDNVPVVPETEKSKGIIESIGEYVNILLK